MVSIYDQGIDVVARPEMLVSRRDLLARIGEDCRDGYVKVDMRVPLVPCRYDARDGVQNH
jgi:hypothetical protein